MRFVQPEGWPAPKGYANGVAAQGEVLFIAGQIGWDAAGQFATDDLIAQFDQALANIVAVLTAAGGEPQHVARMTVYVTDMPAYRAGAAGLKPIWRKHFGRHYPAMALVAVCSLVEPKAKVEIEATAVLPSRTG